MPGMTTRAYRDERDLHAMLALVSAAARADGPLVGHFHRGDLVWGLFANLTIDPASRIHLFEDGAGALRGFVWLRPPRGFDVLVDTTRPDAMETAAAMIAWAEGHLRSSGEGDADGPLTTEVASTNAPLRAVLAARGYHPTGRADFQLNHRRLGGEAVPAAEPAPLPEGGAVRPVRLDDAAEVAARAALHREVWEPSKFTAEGYARLRTMPVYRPDLDLVAVTPGGELAAYCIVWWDAETRVALFEPVGTAAAHRRRGYARALIEGALARLRALGATDAIVLSATDDGSAPARGLYAATGFDVVARFEVWERVAAT